MGIAIKHRSKVKSHKKRWDKAVIEDEKVFTRDYALKNKKEIRRVEFELSKLKKLAKEMNQGAASNPEEVTRFIEKLKAQGYLDVNATSLDEVLDIKVRNILERRLSNIIYKNKLARTPKQARQFVVHGHVKVAGKVINSPSYLVPLTLESTVEFIDTSSLADENHPERKMEVEGIVQTTEELSEIPLKTEAEGDFDKKEAVLDDEEADEDKE